MLFAILILIQNPVIPVSVKPINPIQTIQLNVSPTLSASEIVGITFGSILIILLIIIGIIILLRKS
jgi:hypothetical protein